PRRAPRREAARSAEVGAPRAAQLRAVRRARRDLEPRTRRRPGEELGVEVLGDAPAREGRDVEPGRGRVELAARLEVGGRPTTHGRAGGLPPLVAVGPEPTP